MRANLLASLALALAPVAFGADLDVVVGNTELVRVSRGA